MERLNITALKPGEVTADLGEKLLVKNTLNPGDSTSLKEKDMLYRNGLFPKA